MQILPDNLNPQKDGLSQIIRNTLVPEYPDLPMSPDYLVTRLE